MTPAIAAPVLAALCVLAVAATLVLARRFAALRARYKPILDVEAEIARLRSEAAANVQRLQAEAAADLLRARREANRLRADAASERARRETARERSDQRL